MPPLSATTCCCTADAAASRLHDAAAACPAAAARPAAAACPAAAVSCPARECLEHFRSSGRRCSCAVCIPRAQEYCALAQCCHLISPLGSMLGRKSRKKKTKKPPASWLCFTCQLHVTCCAAAALGHQARAAFRGQRFIAPQRYCHFRALLMMQWGHVARTLPSFCFERAAAPACTLVALASESICARY